MMLDPNSINFVFNSHRLFLSYPTKPQLMALGGRAYMSGEERAEEWRIIKIVSPVMIQRVLWREEAGMVVKEVVTEVRKVKKVKSMVEMVAVVLEGMSMSYTIQRSIMQFRL